MAEMIAIIFVFGVGAGMEKIRTAYLSGCEIKGIRASTRRENHPVQKPN